MQDLSHGLRPIRLRELIDQKIVRDEPMKPKFIGRLADDPVPGITVVEFDTAGVANVSDPIALSRRSR